MRKVLLVMIMLGTLGGCYGGDDEATTTTNNDDQTTADNPFLQDWETPFGVPPFDRIELAHYEPAIMQGMVEHDEEIAAVANLRDAPTFTNTIEAMDAAGSRLTRATSVFGAMNGTMTSDEMRAISKRLAPLRSKHRDSILLNDRLFTRVDAVYQQRNELGLDGEQERLLTETWKRFVRGGAQLSGADKEQLQALNEELSVLSLEFGENVLKETNKFELVIEDRSDLDGLPDAIVAAAAEAAVKRGHLDAGEEGKWVFTIHKPSLIPFLQYSSRRELRETMFKAYTNVGDHDDELDNKATLARVADLRLQRAKLLGFASHADYVLDDNMAKTPAAVYELLNELWTPALNRAKTETADMQALIDAEGGGFELAAWDWWYYAEKVKKAKYDLDEEMLRPYFELENVRAGLFEVVNRLWGLTFSERSDIPVYHPDVKAYEVHDADGSTLAVWYSDYFPRESKRGGAWMSAFRKQSTADGERVIPIIYNVGNFTKPTADTPALLSADEVGTMFHEFGHALHGMLSDCRYRSLSGTSVARDFVELPSQVLENWAFEPETLQLYAKHYQTGELIPADFVAKLDKSKHFNQGFETVEYLAASFLDLDWHSITEPVAEADVQTFEDTSLNRIGLVDEIVSRYRSTYFRHVFSGGYSAGYYAYVWAEVLDADAFQAFRETGDLFDPATAKSFRENILSRGGSCDPMTLYRAFRGKEPVIEPLLARRGLD